MSLRVSCINSGSKCVIIPAGKCWVLFFFSFAERCLKLQTTGGLPFHLDHLHVLEGCLFLPPPWKTCQLSSHIRPTAEQINECSPTPDTAIQGHLQSPEDAVITSSWLYAELQYVALATVLNIYWLVNLLYEQNSSNINQGCQNWYVNEQWWTINFWNGNFFNAINARATRHANSEADGQQIYVEGCCRRRGHWCTPG